jgi:septal ring factor EnvC (AmiA/AmiB activator)
MAVWITPRPKDDVLPPRTERLVPRRSSILFRLLNINPWLVGGLLAMTLCGAIFFILQDRNLAAFRGQMAVVIQERDKFQRDIEVLTSGRRALLRERDDLRDKFEAAEKEIAALEGERDQLRKKLTAAERKDISTQRSPSP